MLRRAVRAFMHRRVLGRPLLWLGAGLLLAAEAAALWSEGPTFLAGVFAAGLVFLAAFVALAWRAHFVNTVGRFRMMDPPEAVMRFGEDGLEVSSSLGSTVLAWSGFVEVWELPGFWMLFLAPNQFVTLPTAGLAPEALDGLRARLRDARPRVA